MRCEVCGEPFTYSRRLQLFWRWNIKENITCDHCKTPYRINKSIKYIYSGTLIFPIIFTRLFSLPAGILWIVGATLLMPLIMKIERVDE